MNIKQITGISLIALGIISPTFSEPMAIKALPQEMDQYPLDALSKNVIDKRILLKLANQDFKDEAIKRAQKGEFISIDHIVLNKSAAYTASLKEVTDLHAAYEAALNGFNSTKEEPEAVKSLRATLAEKQMQYEKLEDEDISASLSSDTKTDKLKREIKFLELEIDGQKAEIASLETRKKVTENKLKGVDKSKVEVIKKIDGMIAGFSDNIAEIQASVNENEAKIQRLKAESEQEFSLSARAKGLRDKRFSRHLVKKDIQDVKAKLKEELTKHNTGRVNKKAVNAALYNFYDGYAAFVEQFVGVGQSAQNCLEQCTQMLLAKAEDTLTKPEGTCSVGALPPRIPSGSDVDPDDVLDKKVSTAAAVVRDGDLDEEVSTVAVVGDGDSDEDEKVKTRSLTKQEEVLMGYIVNRGWAIKRDRHKTLLKVELEKNCEQIKALSKDTSLTEKQRDQFVRFLRLDDVKKQCK